MGKRVPNPTWKYFTRLAAPDTAMCNLCNRKLKFMNSVSNLTRHLLYKHKLNPKFKMAKNLHKLDIQINVRKLIEMVKSHACLWDENSSDFGDKDMTAKAWNTIATNMHPHIDPVIVAGKLSERFFILKENFLNDDNGKRSSCEDCIYYDGLQFLNSSQDVDNTPITDPVDTGQEVLQKFEMSEVILYEEQLDDLCNEDEYQEDGMGKAEANQSSSAEEPSSSQADKQMEFEKSKANLRKFTEETSSRQENKHNSNYMKLKQIMKMKRKLEEKSQCNVLVNNADKTVLFLLSMAEQMKLVSSYSKTNLKMELMSVIVRLVQKYRYMGLDCE